MAAAPFPPPDEILEEGSVLDGRYRIVAPLGGGGTARVYRADHLGIGRQVAIKVLRTNLTHNHEAAARFHREAITSGRLEHPNIVAVSDSGMLHDGRGYLVMELLDGETLFERLDRDGRLPWRTAVAFVRDILLGLRHAHDHGVIHRDIKPENIFVLRRDEAPLVKILDFGIAKLYANAPGDARITQDGLTIGTPAYMSPEQATDGELAPASDLYSTTVVLFEMLTGQPPFNRRDSVAAMKAHISQPPPYLHEVAPEIDIPDGLEEIVQHGLAKLVAARLASTGRYLRLIDELRARDNQSRGGRPSSTSLEAPRSSRPEIGDAPAAPRPPTIEQVGPPRERPDSIRPTTRVGTPSWKRWLIRGASAASVGLAVASVAIISGRAGRERRVDVMQGAGSVVANAGPGTRISPLDAAVSALADAAPAEDAALAEDAAPDPAETNPATGETVEAPGDGATSRGNGKPPRPSAPGDKERSRDRAQARSWLSKGKAAFAAGRFDEAASDFQRAIAADSTAHAALGGLAEVAYNKGDFQHAILTAKQAMALAPTSTAYRMTLAKAYYKILRYADAIKQWQKVIELDPANATAQKNIEMAKAKMGE